ncbi:MAG TPA: hypoxanthine phosphoribosyltransferase [Dehalococcoidia bacterium]|nr:hypoxanthine phosphoribosyltransferase [Dehalococcoidia bacterium]
MARRSALKRLIGRAQLRRRVAELAQEIARDYRDRQPVLVGTLKGSFVFLADLARRLPLPVEIDFIGAASYGQGRESSGQVHVYLTPRCHLQGRHVILVEDIVDTGLTLAELRRYLEGQGPASVRVCALLMKRRAHEAGVTVDYLGFLVPDDFLVGYGLDCSERYRNLPDVYVLDGEG